MIPGVGTPEEMRVTYDAAKAVADAVIAEMGVPVPYRIGTMIERPVVDQMEHPGASSKKWRDRPAPPR